MNFKRSAILLIFLFCIVGAVSAADDVSYDISDAGIDDAGSPLSSAAANEKSDAVSSPSEDVSDDELSTGSQDAGPSVEGVSFAVYSPVKDETYETGKEIEIRVKQTRPVGSIGGSVYTVIVEIVKDDAVKERALVPLTSSGKVSSLNFTLAEPGTYLVNVGASSSSRTVTDGNLIGSYTFNVIKAKSPEKKANTMTVKAKQLTVSSNKKGVYKISKLLDVKKAQGKVTYKLLTNNKKIKFSKNKVVVEKGLKKGKTYNVKFKVTAKGNENYKSSSKTVTVKIKAK